jgi:hypothetical protein
VVLLAAGAGRVDRHDARQLDRVRHETAQAGRAVDGWRAASRRAALELDTTRAQIVHLNTVIALSS